MLGQLGQRVITAVVLLGVLFATLYFPYPWLFIGLTLLFVVATAWEWLRLTGLGDGIAALWAVALGLLLGGIQYFSPEAFAVQKSLFIFAGLIWLALSLGLVITHQFPAVGSWRRLYQAAALILTAACWLALVKAYQAGLVFMLSIMTLVWVADIAAYFSGKAFGRHKLAPHISPGKTWEGVAGAMLCVCAIAFLLTWMPAFNASFSSQLFARSTGLALVLLAVLVGISVVGDLFESHLKRQAGVKDSSRLLPGHGGVFDRIDALLPTLPLALLVQSFWLR